MIAVTGASGLLGQHLVERLVAEGLPVRVIVRNDQVRFPAGVAVYQTDVLDLPGLFKALDGVTLVIHAAGLVSFNPRRRDEIFSVNVEGTRNVVNTCLKVGVKSFIQISSVSALGRKPGTSVTEEDPWTGLYVNDYARSKYLAELEAFRGGEEGLTVSVVNPSVILSGNPLHRSSGSLFDYVWNEKPFYTSGMLNFVDIRDVVDTVIKLIDSPRPGERITLNGGSIPYREFFNGVARRWKKQPPNVKVPGWLVSFFGIVEEIRGLLTDREPMVTRHSAKMTVRKFQYDTTKAREKLGITFRNIDDTLDWCCATYLRDVNGNK